MSLNVAIIWILKLLEGEPEVPNATVLLAGGGLAVYAQQSQQRSRKRARKLRSLAVPDGSAGGLREDEGEEEEALVEGGGRGDRDKASSSSREKKGKVPRKGGVKSVLALATVLVHGMGERGTRSILALAGMAVIRTAVSNRLAKVQGFLFRAAFLKRVPLFARLIVENLALCLAQSLILSSTNFVRGALSLQWRSILTERIHHDYFQNMVYYKLSHVDGRVSSPEQRIASDVPRFCAELADLLQENIVSVFDALFYTYRLCTYTDIKYALGVLLMAEEQQKEGEYRNLHTRLRTHSESIAFYRGHDREAAIITQKFRSLVRHVSRVLRTQWWFGIIQDFFLKYCGATWAVVLIIGPFFGGALKPDGTLTGRADMLSNMRYHTSVVIALFQAMGTLASSTRRLSRMSGFADRIRELMSVSRELRTLGGPSSPASSGSFVQADRIEFENVTVVTPAGTKLVENLTLRIDPGCNLLITGPNGSGKSSLFRVLGGLWPLVSGSIAKPGLAGDLSHEIFYVPQRPYTAVGTLRDQLVYPLTTADLPEPLSEARMRDMLQSVDLESLVERYPAEQEVNWGEELSLGEQQRLGMARLFYHSPAFAILDECTSAVTTDMEERFCAKVRAMGTTCVTISHRPALVAFHDVVLALDGEGGWSVHHKKDSMARIEEISGEDEGSVKGNSLSPSTSPGPSERSNDASVNMQHFLSADKSSQVGDGHGRGRQAGGEGSAAATEKEDYVGAVLNSSPPANPLAVVPAIPRPKAAARSLPQRVSSLMKILVPRLLDGQGGRLAALALLVVARTFVSDRIASLNGASVKNVVQQDKAAFVRLIAISVLQSSASSIIAPTLRHLTAALALGWRCRLTDHLMRLYFKHKAYYKAVHLVEGMDADQRLSQDVDKLCRDLSGLITNMVKPLVDILWFTWRMQGLTGRRGVGILYTYMLLGLGFLRAITPDFGALTSKEQQLEGSFRYMHSRLRTHAESVAFFGGGSREQAVVQGRFQAVLAHAHVLLRKRWAFGIADEFISKQLPHNVTWGLSLLYALDHPEGAPSSSALLGVGGSVVVDAGAGQLAQDLRFLASVVSQSFLAFGDLLELYRKFLELSGGITRVSELDEFLHAAQKEAVAGEEASDPLKMIEEARVVRSLSADLRGDEIAFRNVDVVTPAGKLLARKLTLRIRPGQSLLVTGPNGSGKSSLFRVLGGLWPLAAGTIAKPGSGPISSTSSLMSLLNGAAARDGDASGLTRDTFYVPQRPYTALGTLRDQIIYPLSRADAALKVEREDADDADGVHIVDDAGPGEAALAMLDRRLRSILEDVRLVYLLERQGGWDTSANWEDMLSLGEQQRLGMARLFFHRPKFGILDECTNATSVDVEESLYRKAQRLGITAVTISQRPALIPYHSLELRLIDGEGSWELRSIKRASS
eukprot:jgi/Mesen1/9674/ME000674S09277